MQPDSRNPLVTAIQATGLSTTTGEGTEGMRAAVGELLDRLDLLRAWTWRILRARYQQSLLGGAWAIIQPTATVVILSVVFTRFVHVDTGGVPYLLFAFATVVPWTLLSAALGDMVGSLVDNMALVSKIYFPREILPLSAALARLIDFGIATGVILLLLVVYRMPLFPGGWAFMPIILAVQFALVLGLGFAGAAINVFFRDVKHAVALGLQLWFYASPVLYQASAVPASMRGLYSLNPMVGILEAYRSVLVYGRLPDGSLIYSALVAVALLFVGYRIFKAVEARFADVL